MLTTLLPVANTRLGDAHKTLREVAADEIRAMIRRGDLQPGERLLEDRLAEELGVSRNPIREAIRILENTGLVEVKPRRGAHVATLDPARAVELLELRSVLEAFAAQLAAAGRSVLPFFRLRQVPITAVGMITAADVPLATTGAMPNSRIIAGTITIPPPTPSSPARMPVASPSATSARTTDTVRAPRPSAWARRTAGSPRRRVPRRTAARGCGAAARGAAWSR